MLRETVFRIGGATVIALGIALGAGLAFAGAGLEYAGSWLAAGIAVGLGVFLIHVGGESRRFRLAWLRAVEEGRPPPPGGPPR